MHLVMNTEPVAFTATAGSQHYPYRWVKAPVGYVEPGGVLHLLIKPGLSRSQIIENLERLTAWLRHGDKVQKHCPDTFFCEVSPIPSLEVIEGGKPRRRKRYAARCPDGRHRLI